MTLDGIPTRVKLHPNPNLTPRRIRITAEEGFRGNPDKLLTLKHNFILPQIER